LHNLNIKISDIYNKIKNTTNTSKQGKKSGTCYGASYMSQTCDQKHLTLTGHFGPKTVRT